MTVIADDTRREDYTAAAAQTVFPYSFALLANEDIDVYLNSVLQSEGTDYSLSGVGVAGGGNVTLTNGATAGDLLILNGDRPIARATDFDTAQQTLLAAELNTELSAQVIISQQLERDISRCLRAPLVDQNPNFELGAKSARLGKYLRFSASSGDPELAEITASTTVLSKSVIADFLYPNSAAEIAAGVTGLITDRSFLPLNIKRYGAIGDNVADDTVAIQTAINVASFAEAAKAVRAPAGHYKFTTTLYFHRDVTNNPGFSSAAASGGHIHIRGDGPTDYSAMIISGVDKGTILHWTPASNGNGILIGDGTQQSRGAILKDLSVIGNTTDAIIKYDLVSRTFGMERCFIWNNGAGDAVIAEDTFLLFFRDVYLTRTDSGRTGIGLHIRNPSQSGGLFVLDRVTARHFDFGLVVGNHIAQTGNPIAGLAMAACQAISCMEGLTLGFGVQNGHISTMHTEDNATAGIRVFRGARCCTFDSPYFNNANATEGDIVLGESGGSDSTINHGQLKFNTSKHINVNVNGYKRYSTLSAESVKIDMPEMTMKSGATATGINIAAESQHGLEIIRPVFTNAFTTEISNLAFVDLYVAAGTLGRRTYKSDVQFDNEVVVSSGFLALPLATTANLADVGHAVNTGAEKVEGSVYFNTDTNNPVYATGPNANSVWVNGIGTTVHSPI